MSADFATPSGSAPLSSSIQAPAGLSQAERAVDVFLAPSKTFTDILRNASWWMPLVLMVIFSCASNFTVARQVGFDHVYENQLHNSPKQEDSMNQLAPDQRAQRMKVGAAITRGVTYAVPLFLLVGFAFYALILWASFNFGLGAATTFNQVMAVCFYASLPYLLTNILTIVMLLFGANADAFDIKNPVGTNPAYYMPDGSPVVRALLNRLDIVQIWTLILVILGMSIISRKTITQSAVIVGGFWLLVTLISVGFAAVA